MIRKIARKEFIEMTRDGRFRTVAMAVCGLLVVAIVLGAMHHRREESQRDDARRATREHWLAQGEKNPHAAAHFGVFAFKPESALSPIDRGVNDFVGTFVFLEAHRQNEFRSRPAEDSSASGQLGALTAAVILQFLVPLLIIALGFASFAGERETGTLRQLLSIGVSPRKLIAGKWFGVVAVLAVLFIPTTIIAAGVLSSIHGLDVPRCVMLAIGYLLYDGCFLGLTLAVSALASSSRMSLLTMLGFWVTVTLILPRVIADSAEIVHPLPSLAQFRAGIDVDLKKGLSAHATDSPEIVKLRERVLKQYGKERVEDLPINFDGLILQASEDSGNAVFDRHYRALWSIYHDQDVFRSRVGVFAPASVMRDLSMALAGTDFEHHRHFAEVAETYRRGLIRQMNHHITHHMNGAEYDSKAHPELWSSVEDFRYEPPSAVEVFRSQRTNFAILAGWCIVALGAAWIAAMRVKP